MQAYAATKLDDFANGRISRRRLLETLTAAATAASASGAKAAAADPALQVSIINHISYVCPDFKRAADWYTNVFGLDQLGLRELDVALPFGRQGEKPFGVTADDVPLTHILTRTRAPGAPAVGGGRRGGRAVVSGVGYTVADFDRDRVRAGLRQKGIGTRDSGPYALETNDPFGIGVRISGLALTALNDG